MTKLTCGRRIDSTEDDRGAITEAFSISSGVRSYPKLVGNRSGTRVGGNAHRHGNRSSGAVVAGATVVVHSEETGADVRSVTTSDTGSFNITNLPAGRYTVTVRNSWISNLRGERRNSQRCGKTHPRREIGDRKSQRRPSR